VLSCRRHGAPGTRSPAGIDRADLGPHLAELGGIRAIVRSQRVASTLPPPMAKPLTRAITGLERLGSGPAFVDRQPTTPRPSYWPSCADWSPPVQKALSPAPVSTMLAICRHCPPVGTPDQFLQRCARKAYRAWVGYDDPRGALANLIDDVRELCRILQWRFLARLDHVHSAGRKWSVP